MELYTYFINITAKGYCAADGFQESIFGKNSICYPVETEKSTAVQTRKDVTVMNKSKK